MTNSEYIKDTGSNPYGDYIEMHITGYYPMDRAKLYKDEVEELIEQLQKYAENMSEKVENPDWDNI